MRKVLNVPAIDDQHVALLPARTVMSLFTAGCVGGNGGAGTGGIGLNVLNIDLFGNQTNSAGNGTGGNGGSCWYSTVAGYDLLGCSGDG